MTTTKNRSHRVIQPEETERLRATVPDDPIKLPSGHLACEACGVAVLTRAVASRTVLPSPSERGMHAVEFARCSSCEGVRAQAEAYVDAHPALAARLGDIAAERIESALFGLAILGQKPSGDLALLLPRMHPAAHGVWFSNPLTLQPQRCSPYPWAHVSLGQRAELRKAFAATLRDRLALSEPPVEVACPSGGCLLCGVRAIERSAIEVTQRGGLAAVARAVWRPVLTSVHALGRRGPDQVSGHVCPACSEAITDAGGIGQHAIGNAVLAHVQHTRGETKARRLQSLLMDDFPMHLLGWGALNARPSGTPWFHLVKVLDRL